MYSQDALTNNSIYEAVDQWIANPNQAQFTDADNNPYYGHISDWDVSQVTDMSELFYKKSTFNDDINDWDVSNVTDMYRLFNFATSFNQPLDKWNTSNVISMQEMFARASVFNQDINTQQVTNSDGVTYTAWDVSKVTDMFYMFRDADAFNGNVSNWDVSNVTNMRYMFSASAEYTPGISTSLIDPSCNGCGGNFNQDVSSWDVSNVKDFTGMFSNQRYFNQKVNSWDISRVDNDAVYKQRGYGSLNFAPGIGGFFNNAIAFNQPLNDWDVSNIKYFNLLFATAISFNQPLNNWDISRATSLTHMFYEAKVFNQPMDNWNTSNVTDMSRLFMIALEFDQDISKWDVSSVSDMSYTFASAEAFSGDVSNWDVSSVTTMNSMFTNANSFNSDISKWDVSNVTSLKGFVSGTDIFNQPIGDWDISNVTDIEEIFYNADSFNQPLNDWDISKVISLKNVFVGADSFNQDLDNWNTSNITNMEFVFSGAKNFNGDISSWDVSKVTSMREMFYLAKSFNQDISSWNVSNVSNMSSAFRSAESFNQPLNSWDVSNVTNMASMFFHALSFNQDLNSWNTSNVTSMGSMFKEANNFDGDISTWNTSNVEDMSFMFHTNWNFNQDISAWRVSNVRNMREMFLQARVFDQDLSSWDVSSNTDMYRMFDNADLFNSDISSWDVANVSNFNQSFSGADVFDQDISNWDFSSATDMSGFLTSSGMSLINYDNFLIGLSKKINNGEALPKNQSFAVSGLKYCIATSERGFIISNLGWNISGDSKECYATIKISGGNTVQIEVGDEFNYPSATASDAYTDLDVSYLGTVDSSRLGEYAITYIAIDNSGTEISSILTVQVVDTALPVISLLGDATVDIEVGTTYNDAGATASDNYDGDITDEIVTVNNVDTSTVGTYTITYDVRDSSGNDAVEITRTVNVVDTTVPVITLTGSATVDIEVGTTYNDAGAIASDNYDGDITDAIVTVNNVDISTIGTYTITYNVSDASGNAAVEVIRTVNVVDITLPVISLLGDATVDIEVGTTYNDAGATASDNYDGDITDDIVTVNNVDTSTIGTYTVTYNVSDASGNAAVEVSRTITVIGPVYTLPETINFDELILGDEQVKSLLLENTGSGNLNIEGITMPEGYSIDQSTISVAAGSSESLAITFTPVEAKSYEGVMTITSNNGVEEINLTGAGLLVTSIDDAYQDAEEVKVYPNPASDVLNIDLSNSPAAVAKLRLVDIGGSLFWQRKEVKEKQLSVNVSNYKTGIYLLLIDSFKGRRIKKIIINK